MLDELLEYKEYTDKKILDDLLKENSGKKSTKDLKQNRLKYINFSNGYSGISRAMKIIAKYFLNKYDQNIDIAINALKAWAGDKYDNLGIKEIDEIAGYIKPTLFDYYLKNELNTINNNKKINRINIMIKDYDSQLKSFNEDFINKESKASKDKISDFNKVTYQNIIYNMRNKKLNRYVLVCKKDVLNNVHRNKKPLTSNEKDYLLKIVATYLINVKKNQEFVSIVLGDILNWSLCNRKSCKLADYRFNDGSVPIEYESGDVGVKIKLHQSLLENYRILSIDNLKTVKCGEIIYKDEGVHDILSEFPIEIQNDIDSLCDAYILT